jgi:hypothetical protein
MKNIFATMVTIGLLAQMSFAQDLTNTTNKKIENNLMEKSSGVEVGLMYTNLTDVYMKVDGTYTNNGNKYNYSESNKSGTHLGALGININYKDKTALNLFGYYFGAAILQSINTSEARNAVNFYKTQGGMSFTPVKQFSLYTGLNVSYMDILEKNNNSSIEYAPAAGMDFIVEYSLNKIGFQVGYQVLGLNGTPKDSYSEDLKVTGFVSGITTQISYMF